MPAVRPFRLCAHPLIVAAWLAAGSLAAQPVLAATEVQWWHSMTGALGERLVDLTERFNKSQADYKVTPVFKGSYPESMTAGIAAFRAGNAPHIIQVFEWAPPR